jgi:hypothetical protein
MKLRRMEHALQGVDRWAVLDGLTDPEVLERIHFGPKYDVANVWVGVGDPARYVGGVSESMLAGRLSVVESNLTTLVGLMFPLQKKYRHIPELPASLSAQKGLRSMKIVFPDDEFIHLYMGYYKPYGTINGHKYAYVCGVHKDEKKQCFNTIRGLVWYCCRESTIGCAEKADMLAHVQKHWPVYESQHTSDLTDKPWYFANLDAVDMEWFRFFTGLAPRFHGASQLPKDQDQLFSSVLGDMGRLHAFMATYVRCEFNAGIGELKVCMGTRLWYMMRPVKERLANEVFYETEFTSTEIDGHQCGPFGNVIIELLFLMKRMLLAMLMRDMYYARPEREAPSPYSVPVQERAGFSPGGGPASQGGRTRKISGPVENEEMDGPINGPR